jgi:hypothetical protein
MNENKVLRQMKQNLLNEIETLKMKVSMIDQLMNVGSVIEPTVENEPEGNGTPVDASSPSSKRQRTSSPDSIYARIRQVIISNPDQEFTTKMLSQELKKQWKKDYGKKGNLLAVISAILTCKENKNAKWLTREKRNGRWYFQASEKAPLKKTA